MNIRIATESDQKAWDDYVWIHPDAVAYHQFAWGQAVKKAYRFKPVYLIAEDHGVIVGVLPLVRLKIPLLGAQLVSLPYCDLGGVLADNESVTDELCSFAPNLAKNNNDKKVELRQSADNDDQDLTSKVRMVLQLPGSSKELMKGFKAKLRSQVRKPIKDGLTSELGGAELIDDFYKIMTVNMRDLGSPVHSRNWFKAVAEEYGENVRVGIVKSSAGQVIGAGIVLLHKNVVSIPWASTLRGFNRLNPNMLLYWTFLSFAADNGFNVFDFGRSTPGEGTYRFKEQWGSRPSPLVWRDLLAQAGSQKDATSGCFRQRVETVWKKLPVGLTIFAGSQLRKYISL